MCSRHYTGAGLNIAVSYRFLGRHKANMEIASVGLGRMTANTARRRARGGFGGHLVQHAK
jgi:hypothetical protein